MPKQILLAYHENSLGLAETLEKALKPTGASFARLTPEDEDFYKELHSHSGPTLVMVSDDFLKSISTMKHAQRNFQELLSKEDFKIVVVPNQKAGSLETPTNFQRISHIIHYINYWQDLYLAARNKGRESVGISPELEDQMKTYREISTRIGDFLRYLREKDYWKWNDLIAEGLDPLTKQFRLKGAIELDALNVAEEGTIELDVEVPEGPSKEPVNLEPEVVKEESDSSEVEKDAEILDPVPEENLSAEIEIPEVVLEGVGISEISESLDLSEEPEIPGESVESEEQSLSEEIDASLVEEIIDAEIIPSESEGNPVFEKSEESNKPEEKESSIGIEEKDDQESLEENISEESERSLVEAVEDLFSKEDFAELIEEKDDEELPNDLEKLEAPDEPEEINSEKEEETPPQAKEASIVLMDVTREIVEDIPELEAEALALQSSL
ncbi:MAG: hypothetical protein HKN16_03385, partial [Saprospiraceae bacterium]|nr:hypothetical protein [Saprospiraceae bacterium]